MTSKTLLALTALTLCLACEKKDAAPADNAEKTTAAAPAPSVAPVAAADTTPTPSAAPAPAPSAEAAAEKVPVPADYEGQAQKDLTPQNLNSKLDDLEKEINKH
ncbi:MAG TPA: hypothetical protein VHB79_19695 [Polyangiaceae bacterium]|nr:hypothetical protein [Polyangiaceae bacterium]